MKFRLAASEWKYSILNHSITNHSILNQKNSIDNPKFRKAIDDLLTQMILFQNIS